MMRTATPPVEALARGELASVQDAITGYALGVDLAGAGPAGRAALRLAVLDWVGVTVAGSAEPSAGLIQEAIRAEGGTPASPVLGTGLRCAPRQAALANGVAGHALDYDDMGLGGLHPSAVVMPAVFALAGRLDSSGAQVAEALLAGYQALAIVSLVAGWSAYRRGFHATGTVGTFGAAVGCGKLLGFDAHQYRAAIGLAATEAAGVKASFGTMAKHLNAGNAAANGLFAAQLAARGFTAADDGLQGRQGFLQTHGDPADVDLRRPFEVLGASDAVTQLLYKVHASCGGTHATIESVRAVLDARPGLDLAEIADVEVTVSPDLIDMCGIPDPRTGLEGKFSLRHAAALAVLGAGTGPSGFTDEAVADPTTRRARELVRVVPSARLRVDGPAEVTVAFRDGTRGSASVNPYVPIAADELPARMPVFVDKFSELVAPVLGQSRAGALVDAIGRFDELPALRTLTDLTVP
jgi:2-methylcitrate dehydratase PrpD